MRQPKPWKKKRDGKWYVQFGAKQKCLGADKQAAFRKYHELMAARGRSEVKYKSVAHLFDAFLEWAKEHRSPATFDKALHYLNHFARFLGKGYTIEKLEPVTLLHWVEAEKSWSSSTRNDAISIVQRAFNWAVKRGSLHRSPVANVDGKPSRTRREIVFSPSEWKELRSLVTDVEFGDLLDFMWDTGVDRLKRERSRQGMLT